jgi:hypothetical protein
MNNIQGFKNLLRRFFIPQFFSRFFSTFPQTSAAHLRDPSRHTACHGTPVENRWNICTFSKVLNGIIVITLICTELLWIFMYLRRLLMTPNYIVIIYITYLIFDDLNISIRSDGRMIALY